MKEKSERLWNSNYLKVMTANFSMSFAFYLLTPLLPLYLSEEFSASKDTIGLVLSGYTVTALLMRPFSGYVVDSFSRKKVLVLSLFIYFLCFAGYLTASTLLLFAIVRTMHGAPFGASSVANSTMAIDVLPSSRRTEGIGYYGLSNNLATAIAPTIGVFVYRYYHSFDLLFWLAFIVAGLGFAVDATIRMPERQTKADKKVLSLDRFFLVRGWIIGLNMAFFGLCYGVLSNYLAIYGKEMMNYYGSALLIGLGNGHLWPAFQNMIISIASNKERGTANSTLLTCWDLGLGMGVLLGGIIVEQFNYEAAFWWIVIMHVAGAMLFFLATRNNYQQQKKRFEKETN